MFRQAFQVDLDLQKPLEKFIKTFPHHFLPCAVSGYIYHTEGNTEKATELFNFAHQLADEYPEVNKHFVSLLPRYDQFFGDLWDAEICEIIPDKIWVIKGAFLSSDNDPSPIDLQSSIVRLEGGDIIIINPIQFSKQQNADEMIGRINKLGNVVAIISSTATHGASIEDCHNIWSDAKLFGTHEDNKHGRPRLPWSGFLHDSNQLFEPDLFHYRIKGQSWNETVFYHPESKTLLGLTDLGISPLHSFHSWSMVVYCIALGMWRGNKTKSIALQNYQTIMITDREAFKESWAGILLLDVQHVILGHGGTLQGNEASEKLRDSLAWILDRSFGLSMFEKLTLPPLYAFRVGIPSLLLQVLWKKIWNK